MFAYCGNNPITNSDPDGKLFGGIVGGIIGGLCGALFSALSGDSVWAGALTGATTGFIVGSVCDTVATGGLNLLVGTLICGVVSAAGNFVNQSVNYILDMKNEKMHNPPSNKNEVEEDSFSNYIDWGSIAVSGFVGATFAPVAVGGNNVVNHAFSNMGGLTNTISKYIASALTGASVSILQIAMEQGILAVR